MTTPTRRRGRLILAAVTAAVAVVTISAIALAQPGRPAGPAFPPLHPAAAPASWRHVMLPDGTATAAGR